MVWPETKESVRRKTFLAVTATDCAQRTPMLLAIRLTTLIDSLSCTAIALLMTFLRETEEPDSRGIFFIVSVVREMDVPDWIATVRAARTFARREMDMPDVIAIARVVNLLA